MDLQLAPGLRVVSRGHDHLQIGLYDARRVLLPRTAAVESTLEALLTRRPVSQDETTAMILDRLRRHGCVTGRDEELRRAERRRATRVAVLGGLRGALADTLSGMHPVHLLTAAGVTVETVTRPDDDVLARADVVLVLSSGEIARERLDPLIRSGTSHLVVRLVDGAAVVGPFVVPGLTACLRCIDAHRSIPDPDHVTLTSRYVQATMRARPDGVPDVTDPVLAVVAVAWAVRDVIAHADGRRPSTWSRTLFLDPEPVQRLEQDWSRHPECGCCWPAHGALSGTMGA